ncbi:MAG: hypothetical protein RBT78_05390 [Kiritimatiellia bacterium]|jgi:hypothetical protein|nr:hypothetical protein [Kiritimatiellia bacterium]
MRRSFAAWATGIALGLACAAFGQVQTSVREWRESAFKKFALGEFEAAIPDLKMLIETLKDVKTSQGLAELEILQYNLASRIS